MTAWPMVGVAGARGVVGGVFLQILRDAGLPPERLRCYGNEPGSVAFDGSELEVVTPVPETLRDLDVLFLATDAARSREIVDGLEGQGPVVVDNSSAFRLDETVPLVVPEANADALRTRPRLIANPNCTTAAVVVALAPIRDRWGLESVDIASYQAVSGAGRGGLDAFEAERMTRDSEAAGASPFAGRIADSVVPQIDVLDEDGWSGEENKIRAELRKILELPGLDVAATAVRVPVRIGHSVALHLRTERTTTVAEIEDALRGAPGVEYRSADGRERHPMPLDVAGRDPVIVGRLRAIPGRERGFALFLSSDNLRKGAALNAVQVAASLDPERFGCLLPAAS
ncbi:MAG: aspartate-semialdehyde dehydrogenase [Candidatus Limnocylindria bacterium]